MDGDGMNGPVMAGVLRLVGTVAAGMVVLLGLTAADAAAATPNLQSLVVQSGEMPGFTPSNDAQSAGTLAQWVKVQGVSRAEAVQLRKAGFVAGLQEDLSTTSGAPAVAGGTAVWYFKTPLGVEVGELHTKLVDPTHRRGLDGTSEDVHRAVLDVVPGDEQAVRCSFAA